MRLQSIKYYLFLLLLVLAVLPACEYPYRADLNTEDMEPILVVEGLISDEPGSFEVKLSRSVALDTMVNYVNESGAMVYIQDDQGTRYDLYETQAGLYQCPNTAAKTEVGRSYQLFIVDAGNVSYESAAVKVEASPNLDELDWQHTTKTVFENNEAKEQKAIDIFINANDDTNATQYYQWNFEETWEVVMPNNITALDGNGMPYPATVQVPNEKKYCWVTKGSQNILIKSVENQDNSSVNKFVVQTIDEYNDRLLIRYSILVKQYRINAAMYDFWKKLKNINENPGSLYDQVPSSVFGNISCCDGDKSALGYFNAVQVKTKRIFIENYEQQLHTVNFYDGCSYVTDLTSYHFVDHFYARIEFCGDCRAYGSNEKPEFW